MPQRLDSDNSGASQERHYDFMLRKIREEREMKLINDGTDPELVALLDNKHELATIEGWVNHLNKDLIDSGYEQYTYKTEVQGKKAYIRKV